jgi:peroxiredoxin
MKSQAEVAGHLSRSNSPRPQKGTVLRDVELRMFDGSHRLLSSLRGQSNLVIVFTAGRQPTELLQAIVDTGVALKEQNAQLLIIHSDSLQPVRGSALIAIDPDFHLHRALGAVDDDGNPIPAIYVTDHFGELFGAFRSVIRAWPDPDEIISWLEFVNQQCEECSPPEW